MEKRHKKSKPRAKRREKIQAVPLTPPSPSPNAGPRGLQLLISLLFLALFFAIPFHPLVRMYRTMLGEDDFKKLKVSFQVDGVPALWGYSGWQDSNSHLKESQTAPPLLNQNAQGSPLSINGAVFADGIGVHAPSRLALSPDGKFSGFSCQVGLDSNSNPSRGVFCYLLADGKEIFRSRKIYYGADPCPIDVPISGVKQLVLCADTGNLEDIWSDVDWVNLKFVP